MHSYNVFTENLLLHWALFFPLNSLGTHFYVQDFTHSTFFAWNTFVFNLPICLDYFYLSFRIPFPIHLLWFGTLTMEVMVRYPSSDLSCWHHLTVVCPTPHSSVSPLHCQGLWSRLSYSSLYFQCRAQHLTPSRPSIMNKYSGRVGFQSQVFSLWHKSHVCLCYFLIL